MPPDAQDQEVIRYGYEAVQRPIGAVLDDGVTAKPTKQKKGEGVGGGGQTVVLVAAGFGGYSDEAEEIEAIKSSQWVPHSADFKATAEFTTRGYFEVFRASEFVGALGENTTGKIGRIVFIGHGCSTHLGLSGHREGAVTRFSQSFTVSDLENYHDYVLEKIQPKLDPDAVIDLVACESGIGKAFTEKLAATFNRCVRGFKGPVFWEHPINDEKTKIVNRGRVSSDNQNFHNGISGLAFDPPICPPAQAI
jgi:hypothetical protein